MAFSFCKVVWLIKPNKALKLVETLLDNKNYVCHYENLKFYVKHGLVVEKMHRVCEFERSEWLGAHIEKKYCYAQTSQKRLRKELLQVD